MQNKCSFFFFLDKVPDLVLEHSNNRTPSSDLHTNSKGNLEEACYN